MRKKFLWAASAALLLTLIFAAVFCVNAWQSLDLAKIQSASLTAFVYDRNGQVISGVHSGENRVYAPLSSLPDSVVNAFLAAEDTRFWHHHGVDAYRVFGALAADIRSRSLSQGASTITQQLVKLTQLSPEKTFSRKLREAVMALRLEREMSKDAILEAYLNRVYFGAGAYGVQAAAQTYFDTDAASLTPAQAALLAGILKSPSRYAPHLQPENALARRNSILAAMRGEGYLDEAQYAQAVAQPVRLRMAASAPEGWYVDAALDEAAQRLAVSRDELLSGGYHIYTCMDPGLQAQAETLFADPANFPANASDGQPVQAALAAVEPEGGGVLALMGGREYLARGFDRATRMRRQPGSAFKPVSVYAAAVDAYGYLPSDTISDSEKSYGGYAPRNFSGSYRGQVTLRQALSASLNAAAVELISITGVDAAREYAQRLGLPLSDADQGYSLALGALTDGVTPLELAASYAALANGGCRVTPHIVARVLDRDGREIYTAARPIARAIKPETAFLLTSMLETAASSGTAKALSGLSMPVAAKTGTVGMENGRNRDAWTAAYTPDVAVAVWMGFDQPDETHALPASVTGGGFPARLVAGFLAATHSSADSFPVPDSLFRVVLDKTALEGLHTALLASPDTPEDSLCEEYFPAARLPRRYSTLWIPPQAPEDAFWDDGAISFTALSGDDEYVILENGQPAAALRGQFGQQLRYQGDSDARYEIYARNAQLFQAGVDIRSEPVTLHAEPDPFWNLFSFGGE